ncbi:MAG TPA: glycosyltransferase family 4 protein [Methanocella sp.]|nr:glycosyltransferase family 4 protein [Methanocella sp.]
MGPLKIAFFCWESIYAERIGGLSPGATYLAEVLARNNEVHFFTRGGEDRTIKGVHYHYVQPYAQNIVDYSRHMSDLMVARFREFDAPRFDVLHFHDWHVVDALHQLADRNTVMTFHSTEYGRAGNRIGDWWEAKEIAGKEWYGAYIAKRLTAVSHTLKSEIMWLYNVPYEKVDVISNGIFPEVYEAVIDAGKVKESYGIHPYAPLVLFVGRMEYQKGPDLLADAVPLVLQQRWDAKFIMAGQGTMKHELQTRCAGLPVWFPGYISDSEYVRLLNACETIVIPSRNEPFGLVPLEAWSARKCPVVADVGGLSENIANFADGVKVYLDPASIAWGINYVLSDPARAAAFGRNGRRKVEKQFLWNLVAEKMTEVYRKVIK